jgi:hypothetical protein
MATKRISNPVTGKYYSIRQRTTKSGRKGKIKGLYSSEKRSSLYVTKNFGDVIKRLSNQ